MHYTPHDYQEQAAQFIIDHPAAAIFLGMGLGKTVITLTALHELTLDRFEIAKTLIIAPLRVARDTWPAELTKWDHLTRLTASVVVGTAAERRAALETEANLYITNRENIPWLVNQYKADTWPFDMIVIDELSSFKSHNSKRTRALVKIRPAVSRIVGLTGTPASNGLMDLFAQFRILDMGQRLGRYITRYRDRYFQPDKRNSYQIFSYKPREGAEDEIYDAIGDITMSLKTTDHLKLPPLATVDKPVRIPASAWPVYTSLRDEMIAEIDGETIDAVSAGALAGKLLQLASGAVYTDGEKYTTVHEAKLDALEDVIESANGSPVLIAYWFKHDRARILARFPGARPLDTSQDFHDWNQGTIPVALIHPASAGHGLNLQAGGHILVWFSLTWSLELYQQTNARLYRQGQTEPVTVVHLVAQKTIDERVVKALQSKDNIQDALIEAVKTMIERKTRETHNHNHRH